MVIVFLLVLYHSCACVYQTLFRKLPRVVLVRVFSAFVVSFIKMDLNLLCRLCAKEDRLCIQVFGTEGIKQNVAKKIRLCLPIIVKETDDFPKQICLNCLSNLDTSYELYTRCLEAQSVIKNMITVNRQNRGEIVKVYSTQEMLKMVNELRDKMCEKRPAVRLGNTVFTIRDTGNQTENSSNDEQRAKKRKQDVVNTGGRGVMYPVGPLGQQYMLMPSTAMPPAVMIPSAVPHGQFAIAPLPAVQSFPVPPLQPLSQKPVTSASTVQAKNAEMPVLTPELVPPTSKVTTASSAPVAAVLSSASAAQQPSTAEAVSVQSVQSAPLVQTAQPSASSREPMSKVQQTSTRKASSVPESAVQPQITSVQNAIQVFKSPPVQPAILPQVPITSRFTVTGKGLQPLQSSSVPSETALQRPSVQPLPQITIQTKQERESQDVEESAEILPLITSDPLGPKESLSTMPDTPQQASTQGTKAVQPPNAPVMVNMGGGDDDDDDDDYAADDPDPLQDSGEEEQDKTEDNTAADKTVPEPAPEVQAGNRDTSQSAVEEVSSDGSAAGGANNTHMCPYCNKYFPDDVIFHHKKLHFRQKFFSCITCNKNFRTEAGLETHRCE